MLGNTVLTQANITFGNKDIDKQKVTSRQPSVDKINFESEMYEIDVSDTKSSFDNRSPTKLMLK